MKPRLGLTDPLANWNGFPYSIVRAPEYENDCHKVLRICDSLKTAKSGVKDFDPPVEIWFNIFGEGAKKIE